MRQCPTLPGDDRPLIAHTIANPLCLQRQRDFYHKCHRCVFRGLAARDEPEPGRANGVERLEPAVSIGSGASVRAVVARATAVAGVPVGNGQVR